MEDRGLDAALSLGENRVKGEEDLPDPEQAGEDDHGVAGS